MMHARFTTSLREPERAAFHLGFDITCFPASMLRRVHNFFEDFLVYSLIWAFHPRRGALRRNCGKMKRVELWLSKDRFQEMYGVRAAASSEESETACVD